MRFYRLPIARKLLFSVVLISSAVTAILTTFSLYLDYSEETEHLDKRINEIRDATVPALSAAIWEFNESLLNSHLSSILTVDDIVEVDLLDPEGNIMMEKGREDSVHIDSPLLVDFPLEYDSGSEQITIGVLRARYTMANIYDRVATRALVFFSTQGLKTLIVSFLILAAFHHLLVRHIKTIERQIQENTSKISSKWQMISLSRSTETHDELTTLVKTLNVMGSSALCEVENSRNIATASERLANLGETAASIGHEINNPLNVAEGFIRRAETVLQQRSQLDQELETDFEKARNSLRRVYMIMKGLLSLSRDGTADPRTPFPAKQFVDSVLAVSESKAKRCGVSLSSSVEESQEIPEICSREVVLSQILVNLVSNAIDAAEKEAKSWVKVDYRFEDETHILRVADSGPGIRPEIREKIFESFFTTKPVGKGTGLGLALSQRLTAEEGGQLCLLTDTENTTFEVRIPHRVPEDIAKESDERSVCA